MALDSSIYQMIRPVQPGPGPLEQFSQVAQLRNMLGAQELNELQRQKLSGDLAEEEAFKRALGRVSDFTKPLGADIFAVSPSRAQAFEKTRLEGEKARAELEKTRLESRAKNVVYLRDRMAQVGDQAGYDLWREEATRIYGPDFVRNLPPQFSADVKMQLIATGDQVISQLEAQRNRDVTTRGQDLTATVSREGHAVTDRASAARLAETQAANLQQERIAAENLRFNTGVNVPPRTATAPLAPRATAAGPAASPSAAATQAAPQSAPPAPAPAAPGLTPKQAAEQAAKDAERDKEVSRTLNAYIQARNGLLSGLAGSETGAITGRIPAFTSAQQIAAGGVAAMAPVLKQLFRVAGEGVFTDRDQQLLLDMVPTRADSPEARKVKMENIDRIVAAKLGMTVPAYSPPAPKEATKAGGKPGIKFLGFEDQ